MIEKIFNFNAVEKASFRWQIHNVKIFRRIKIVRPDII